MKITINAIPPSNNEFMGNSKNFNIYRKQKEMWHLLIKQAIKNKPEKPYEKAEVIITYYFKDNRRRDADNYSGKMLLDPLTREGIIVDDDFEHIILTVRKGGVDKENPRTEIEIKEK